MDEDVKKVASEFTHSIDAENLSCDVKGKSFSGKLKVEGIDDTSSQIIISIKLPFHFGLLKTAIQDKIEKKLELYLKK